MIGNIRMGKSDILLKIVAYAMTILWVLIALVPLYWLITSTMKDMVSIYKTPPEWIPAMPKAYVFQVEYKSDEWNNVINREKMFETDFALISWQIFDSYKTHNVGQVIVQAIVDDKIVARAKLGLSSFKRKRDNLWAATSLNPEQILKKIEDLHEVTVNALKSYTYNIKNKVGGNYIHTNATVDMKVHIEKWNAIKGNLQDVYLKNSPESLLDNFSVAWNYPKQYAGPMGLGRMLFNSIFIAAVIILGQWVLMGMSGYALSKILRKKASNILLVFFLITMMIPGVVTFIPLFFLIEKLRLMNTLWAVIIPSVPNAFNMYLFKGFIDNLPNDLFDSARVEGANELKIFFRLILPLTKPVFGVIALFSFLGAWGDFFWPYMVLRSQELWTFPILINKLLSSSSVVAGKIDYPVALAMSVLASIPTLIIFGAFQTQLETGLVFSGIKG